MKEQDQKSSESGDTEVVVSSEIDSNDEVDSSVTFGNSRDEFDPPVTFVRQNAMSAKDLQALVWEDLAPNKKNVIFPHDPQ